MTSSNEPSSKVAAFASRLCEISIRRYGRSRLIKSPFTLLSNNCWGSHLYNQIGLSYASPTVGLFLMPECYLKFLKRIHEFKELKITFSDSSKYEKINESRQRSGKYYPIGLLEQIEVHFLHYRSEAEAKEKWVRRLERMTSDPARIFVKFCDRDGCTAQNLIDFCSLPFQNKICFTSGIRRELGCEVFLAGMNETPDGLDLQSVSPRYFDALRWIQPQGPAKLLSAFWRLGRL